MHALEQFQVDNLLLLIGANPLPNYVAAQMLAKNPATTQIVLVCSQDTRDEAAKRLEELLSNEGFAKITYCEVEEANPQHIRNQVMQQVKLLTGSIGLHYTGGTKAMSVHAYLALQTVANDRAQYSYLDARTLSMQIEAAAISGGAVQTLRDVGKLLSHPLTIKLLLELHDLEKLQQAMQMTSHWSDPACVLARLYLDADRSKHWRAWCQHTLRDQAKKGELKKTNKLDDVRIADIPDEEVQQAFLTLYPELARETALPALAQKVDIGNSSQDLAKWFDGEWLEHYVLTKLQPLKDHGTFHELVMTVEPKLGQGHTFEFDVAGIHGYQLFAFSVTTAEKRHWKPKLLEAVVRAEQMGGSEARVALVCYASREEVQKLEREIATLFRQRQLTKVFGRDDLLDLDTNVARWISASTQEAKPL